MIHKALINPKSIVVVGGSDNISSPGGRVLKNLIDTNYNGDLYVLNPKKDKVQGISSFTDINNLPKVDLAIIAIAAKYIKETVKILTEQNNTKAFIIYSAGFSEKGEEGAKLEQEIVKLINKVGGSLLGPNNIGLINTNYAGVFTTPIPKLDKKGVNLISGSGATAVFIMEAAKATGLSFNSVFTVGNSAQIGVEDILEYFDEKSSKKKETSKIILLYIESITNPKKLLKHSLSLAKKGYQLAAIKAGSSSAGSRAATSHTGAMANSDVAVDALFEKAGIIRCYGRNELINVATVLQHKKTEGKRFAIITHAGGPAVMLTDVLEKNGLEVPKIENIHTKELLSQLYDGSSVQNPIDFLATGTAEQLETIIQYCDTKFTEIDGIIIIFGSPGLTEVFDVYDVIDKYQKTSKKPIYAVMPSVINVKEEIDTFISKGNLCFNDEVLFGDALAKVYNKPKLRFKKCANRLINISAIEKELQGYDNEYITTKSALKLMEFSHINCVSETVYTKKEDLVQIEEYPIVMKVIGPIHKSDVGGVILNIKDLHQAENSFHKIMRIKEATAVLVQPMKKGLELFIGVKKEEGFGHLIMCGLGGTHVEIHKDISVKLTPLAIEDAYDMIKKLKIYPILEGVRGDRGIDIDLFAETILQVSKLVNQFPEIEELDINPLLANHKEIIAVDSRIKVE
jgi:acetyltransferase